MHAALQSAAGAPLPQAGYEALRRVSRAIAAHRDVKKLFRSMADELRPVVKFVFLRVFLYDESTRLMRLHVSEAPGQSTEAFSEFPPEGTAVGWVYERQQALVIQDVDQETRFPRLHGILKEYGEYTKSIAQSGHYRGGNELADISTATTVRVRDKKKLVTDGPFAETKEQLGGYYLIEAKDLDEAIAIAARVPAARYGSVEVRPIFAM